MKRENEIVHVINKLVYRRKKKLTKQRTSLCTSTTYTKKKKKKKNHVVLPSVETLNVSRFRQLKVVRMASEELTGISD